MANKNCVERAHLHFVPQRKFYSHRTTEKALKQMNNLGMITLIPRSKDKDLDDKIMIQHALDHDSWILTGDTFRRDHIPRLLNEGKLRRCQRNQQA